MNETGLSAEAEEILDVTNFSLVALVGFIFSLIGVFSLRYLQAVPFAVIGICLGAVSLWLSARWKTGTFSKLLGVLAVSIGATVTSAGYFRRVLANEYDLVEARKIAEMYLDVVAKGDMDRAYFLGGYDPAVARQTENSETKQMLNGLKTDPAYVAIRGLKTPPNWVFGGIVGDFGQDRSHTYILRYQNSNQTNAPSYDLSVRKSCAKLDRTQDTVHWYVDRLAETKAP
jgi:hypothetical protein